MKIMQKVKQSCPTPGDPWFAAPPESPRPLDTRQVPGVGIPLLLIFTPLSASLWVELYGMYSLYIHDLF